MIEIENRQSKLEVKEDINCLIESVINEALNYENFKKPYEVSVVFTDNEGIRDINKQFRGIDKETDVLSFPMLDFDEGYEEDGEIEIDIEDINPESGCVVLVIQ